MKTVHIRGVEAETWGTFSMGASVRRISQAEYLARLIRLHEHCRSLAERDPEYHELLEDLGLKPVRVLG